MKELVAICVVLLLLVSASVSGAEQDAFERLLSDDAEIRKQAAEEITNSADPGAIPSVAEACFHFTLRRDRERVEEISAILRTLANDSEGKKYFDWVRWIGAHPEIKPLPGYPELKAKVFSQVDPAFAAFFTRPELFTIRMEEVVWGGVKKDGIPALVNPPTVPVRDAKYLKEEDKVLGVGVKGKYRAYPLRIMDWHEMANDTLGGVRIVIPYCTLCGSAILYKSTAGAQVYTFGSSGLLYRSNKLMYDRQTNSLWSALAGEPVAGPLTKAGIKLEMLPIIVTTWGAWRRHHPDTTVLSIATGHDRDYNVEPYKEYFASDKNMFPVPLESRELGPKDFVFTLRVGETKKAYPMNVLSKKKILKDTIGTVRVVIVPDASGRSARAYRCGSESPDSSWKADEEELIAPDAKAFCPRIPGHVAYWFGWFAQFPDTQLYKE